MLPAVSWKKGKWDQHILTYCTGSYNGLEKAVVKLHFAQAKFLLFKDRLEIMAKAYERDTSNDPKVLELLKDGLQEFHKSTGERVYDEQLHELELNRCPKCNGIARTPSAKQSRYCGHDWQ